MAKKMKKLLAVLLALSMVFSMLGVTAFADDASGTDPEAAAEEPGELNENNELEEDPEAAPDEEDEPEEENPGEESDELNGENEPEEIPGENPDEETEEKPDDGEANQDDGSNLQNDEDPGVDEISLLSDEGSGVDDPVAMIGETGYASLQEAINAAKNGDTVKLLKDTEENAPLTIAKGQNVTLDLNGKTLTIEPDPKPDNPEDDSAVFVNGTLTINDSSSGNGQMKHNSTYGLRLGGGNLVVNGGLIKGTADINVAIGINNKDDEPSTCTINGGKLQANSNVILWSKAGSVLTLNGGELVGFGGVEMRSGTLNIPANSSVEITATGYNGEFCYQVETGSNILGAAISVDHYEKATVNIANGTFTGYYALLDLYTSTNENWDNEKNDIKVTGGTFITNPNMGNNGNFSNEGSREDVTEDARAVYTSTKGTIAISGGTFDTDVSAYLTPTVTQDEQGRVVKLDATNSVAQVGNDYYASLQAAIDAANPGDTVTLLKGTKEDGPLTIAECQDVILDLNGKTLTIETPKPDPGDTDPKSAVFVYGKLTIDDSSSEKNGRMEYNSDYGLHPNGGELVVNGGLIEGTAYPNVAIGINNGDENPSTCTINGGVLHAKSNVIFWARKDSRLILNGGTLVGYGGVEMRSGTLDIPADSTVDITANGLDDEEFCYLPISGSNIFGAAISVDHYEKAMVNIAGGTFTGYYALLDLYTSGTSSKWADEENDINVTGGNFITKSMDNKGNLKDNKNVTDNAQAVHTTTDGTIAISGGTFSSDVSEYCVTGMKWDETTHGIVPNDDVVALVGVQTYETLAAAIDAANPGDTVKLLADVELTDGILITKSGITLDGNNHRITVKDSAEIHAIQVYGAKGVTIQDITITGAGKDALLVNGGAEVTAENLNTSGNSWGAVNVDKGSTFTLTSGSLAEANKIWVDDDASEVKVPTDWNYYTDGKQTFYAPNLTLALNPANTRLYSNTGSKTAILTATLDGKTPAVTWKSSDETVATVKDGVVTALSNGTATITATTGSLSASCAVTVSTYTYSGGGGGGSYTPPSNPSNPNTPDNPDPPEIEIDDPDVPLGEKPFLFADVTEGEWFYNDVKKAFNWGLMDGVATTRFNPRADTTRAMVAQILYRLAGEPDVSGYDMAIPDLVSGVWYEDAAIWAYATGVYNGYSDGSFRGEKVISREELATVLIRYAEKMGYDVTDSDDLSAFADKAAVSSWAVDGMQWAVGTGLFKGRSEDRLVPDDNSTRAELATVLVRFVEKYVPELAGPTVA